MLGTKIIGTASVLFPKHLYCIGIFEEMQACCNATNHKKACVRAYAKLLDDRAPSYATYPVTLTGTNDKPVLGNIPGFDVLKDTMLSPNISTMLERQRGFIAALAAPAWSLPPHLPGREADGSPFSP